MHQLVQMLFVLGHTVCLSAQTRHSCNCVGGCWECKCKCTGQSGRNDRRLYTCASWSSAYARLRDPTSDLGPTFSEGRNFQSILVFRAKLHQHGAPGSGLGLGSSVLMKRFMELSAPPFFAVGPPRRAAAAAAAGGRPTLGSFRRLPSLGVEASGGM